MAKFEQNSASVQDTAGERQGIPKATANAAEKIGEKLYEEGVKSMGKADPSYSLSPPSAGKAITKEQGREA